MTEKGKSLPVMIYDANGAPELISDRLDCKELCRNYNDLRPKYTSAREAMLRKIIGSAVPRDIPANSAAAGNPCRVIKSITTE